MTAPQTEILQNADRADRVIVALDVDSTGKAREIVAELEGVATTFKVGLQLFTNSGPGLVEELVSAGKKVFLDLKFHDIPNTVAKAGIEAARLGVWMFNVHASGGSEMMKRTKNDVAEFCDTTDRVCPLIIGVTVLTSMDEKSLAETAADGNIENRVVSLARLANASGLDGIVASAKEASAVRSAVENPGFLIVTPGVRPIDGTKDDQMRVMAPGAALSAGASHLVVGRPIVASSDRRRAFSDILDDLDRNP